MNNKPVAWMHQNPDYPISKNRSLEYNIPLYTHPAKTLTDEEINKIYLEKYDGHMGFLNPDEVRDFARAILRKAQEK